MGRKSTAKARMIGVGKKMFHKYGYQAVSIAQICEKAEVRTGSFFHFFSSKEAFVQLVIDEYWDEFGSMVVSQLQDLEFSPLKRIMNFFDMCYEFIRRQPLEFDVVVGCPFGNLSLELTPQLPDSEGRLIQVFGDWTFLLEQTLRDAVDKNEITEDNPHEASQSIIAYLEGVWLLGKVNNDPEIVRRLIKRAMHLLKIN